MPKIEFLGLAGHESTHPPYKVWPPIVNAIRHVLILMAVMDIPKLFVHLVEVAIFHWVLEARVFDSVEMAIHERLEIRATYEDPPPIVGARRLNQLGVLAEYIDQMLFPPSPNQQSGRVVLVNYDVQETVAQANPHRHSSRNAEAWEKRVEENWTTPRLLPPEKTRRVTAPRLGDRLRPRHPADKRPSGSSAFLPAAETAIPSCFSINLSWQFKHRAMFNEQQWTGIHNSRGYKPRSVR